MTLLNDRFHIAHVGLYVRVTWCRKLHQLVPTWREHVLTTNQSKGIMLIERSRTAATVAASKLPAAAFLTKTHFEIFGLFFPVNLPDLPSAVTLLSDLYHHTNLKMNFHPSVKVVNKSHGAAATWLTIWRQELDTLTR